MGRSAASARALGKIGAEATEAVPALMEALKVEDVRDARANALVEIGPEAKEVVPSLKDNDVHVRRLSASALGGISAGTKDAVPALIEALKDNDAHVRRLSANALRWIGTEAKDAVPALIAAL